MGGGGASNAKLHALMHGEAKARSSIVFVFNTSLYICIIWTLTL